MIGVSVAVSADLELNHMMTAKSVDQIGRSAFGDNLAVVDYGQPVAKPFRFVHVVRGQQKRFHLFLEGADDFPELTPALRIESSVGSSRNRMRGLPTSAVATASLCF